MSEELSWLKLGESVAYDGWIKVRRDRYQTPDGLESDWDVLSELDSVAILAFTSGMKNFVCFKQFRVGPARELMELPGGMIEAGETAVAAGQRELLEEVGYISHSIIDVGDEWAAANSVRRKHVVIAMDCKPTGKVARDENEFGEILELPSGGLMDHLIAGDLTDAGAALRGLLRFLSSSAGVHADLQQKTRELFRPLFTV